MAEKNQSSNELIDVYIETISKEVWKVKIHISETVAALKKKIQRLHGVQVSGQILLFQYKELNNKTTLKDANIRNNTRLILTLKLKSGPMHGVKGTDMEHSFCADITQNFNVSDERTIFLIVEKGNPQLYVCARENDRTYMLPIDYFGLSDCPKINQDILLNMAFNAARFPLSAETLSACILPFGMEICSSLDSDVFEPDEEGEISAEDVHTLRNNFERFNISEVQETTLPVVSPPTNDTSSSTKTPGSSSDMKSLCHFMSFQSRNVMHGRDFPLSSNPAISPQRILSLDQWIDKRPKTMPQRKCFQQSSDSSTCDIDSNHLLSDNISEEKESVLPNSSVLLHLLPQTKSFPISESLLKDGDSKYSLKLPVIHKKRSGCSKTFPEIDANILAATNLKALNGSSPDRDMNGASNSISICKHETGAIPKLPLITAEERCEACKKRIRTGLSMACRCGKKFCIKHRLAEDHMCTYDYKNDGRVSLTKANPRIQAPKLPKI